MTLLVLRAALVAIGIISLPPSTPEAPLLPTSNATTSSAESEKALLSHQPFEPSTTDHHSHSANSSTSSERGNLQVRSTQARTRGYSPNTASRSSSSASPKYTYPLVQHAGYFGTDNEDNNSNNHHSSNISSHSSTGKKVKIYGRITNKSNTSKSKKKKKGAALFWHELKNSFAFVLASGFIWYFYLVWQG